MTAHDKKAAYFFVVAIKPDLIPGNFIAPSDQFIVWPELTRIIRIGSHLVSSILKKMTKIPNFRGLRRRIWPTVTG